MVNIVKSAITIAVIFISLPSSLSAQRDTARQAVPPTITELRATILNTRELHKSNIYLPRKYMPLICQWEAKMNLFDFSYFTLSLL